MWGISVQTRAELHKNSVHGLALKSMVLTFITHCGVLLLIIGAQFHNEVWPWF